MKKEVFFAIFLGLSMGLIVTFGIYTARSAFLKKTTTTDVAPTATPSVSPSDTSLTLYSPEDESIQTSNLIKVTGTTFPEAHVIVFLNNAATITTADKSGNFSIETKLTDGSTVITVRALDDNGSQAEQRRTVFYSSTDLDAPITATASASPSAKLKPSPSPAVKK